MDVVALRILVEHRFVAAHAGKMIDVAGLCEPNNGVDQQVGLRFAGRTERQFLVGAVQGVAGLKGHNLAPAHFAEIGAQFVGRVALGRGNHSARAAGCRSRDRPDRCRQLCCAE